jgi:4-hydroxy-tetrahydrodipicolinate synthase
MTRRGIDFVIDTARRVHAANPAILAPAAEFFNIDIDQRLNDESLREELIYKAY